eukprot:scaffold5920_cov172-Amphora_coffeaeformis.AAC.4
MYSNDPTQQRPVVYVLVQGQQGQNGDTNAPAMVQQAQQQQQQAHQLQGNVQLQQYLSSQGQILQRQPPPVTSASNSAPLFPSPLLEASRRGSHPQENRNQGITQPLSVQGQQQQQQYPPPGGGQQTHQENVQIISIPQFAPSAQQQQFQQQHIPGGQSAFPPPGATIQMISNQGVLQQQQQPSLFPYFQSQPHPVPSFQNAIRMPIAFPLERNAMGNFTMSRTPIPLQQQQHQQQGLIPMAASSTAPISIPTQPTPVTSSDGPITAPGPPPIDPNVKFLHAPPGVTIPPQPFPTYQLVPAGHQVLPTSHADKGKMESSGRKPLDPKSLEARGGAEQQEDGEEEDEERLLREPIVLSGTPYNYPVNIGKDVVSGKGGRAQQYNRHFRRLITEAYPRYNETDSKVEKREIGIRIYLSIVKSGGRFLDSDGHPMNRSKAILKVMKALKDAKTWANDVRRLAYKRRREARERMQQGKPPCDDHHEDTHEDTDMGSLRKINEADHDDDFHEGSEDDEEMMDDDDLSDQADLLASRISEKTQASPSSASIPTVVGVNNNTTQGSVIVQPSEHTVKAPGKLGNSSDVKEPVMPTVFPLAQAPEKNPSPHNSLSAANTDISYPLKSRALPLVLPKEHASVKPPPSSTTLSAVNHGKPSDLTSHALPVILPEEAVPVENAPMKSPLSGISPSEVPGSSNDVQYLPMDVSLAQFPGKPAPSDTPPSVVNPGNSSDVKTLPVGLTPAQLPVKPASSDNSPSAVPPVVPPSIAVPSVATPAVEPDNSSDTPTLPTGLAKEQETSTV